MYIKDISKIEQGLALAKETWPHLLECYKVYRDCLVKAGFTLDEANYLLAQHTTPYGFKENK
jgi:hypothetical protein